MRLAGRGLHSLCRPEAVCFAGAEWELCLARAVAEVLDERGSGRMLAPTRAWATPSSRLSSEVDTARGMLLKIWKSTRSMGTLLLALAAALSM